MHKLAVTDLFPEEIAGHFDLPAFQGRQVFEWLYAKGVSEPEDMTSLSKKLRQRLREDSLVRQLELVELRGVEESSARKALFRLRDGDVVESVVLHHGRRTTLCLSTQVGCPLACAFCATGQSGYSRNLSPGEIAEQAVHLVGEAQLGDRTPNIVYMGMGEPFLNYDAVVRSIRLLMRPEGQHIGARRITVSTVGIVSGIRRFAREDWQVRLSVSLHAANDELRDRLVPINKKYPLKDLFEALRYYQEKSGRQLTFEWALLDGVNDRDNDARELAGRIKGLKATVNLIPFNAIPDAPYQAPSQERCAVFRDILTEAGIKVTLRAERGGDIDAACGQLRRTTIGTAQEHPERTAHSSDSISS